MKKIHRITAWGVIFAGLFLFWQALEAFHLFYVEQNQLFLCTTNYFNELIAQPGGFTLALGKGLTQCYKIAYLGPLILATLLTLIGLLSQAILFQLHASKGWTPLCLLPIITSIWPLLDFNFFLQGTLAYILLLLALLAWLNLRSLPLQRGGAIGLLLALAILGGPIMTLFALFICLLSLTIHQRDVVLLITLPLLVALIGWTELQMGWTASIRQTFLPDLYYAHNLLPKLALYWHWVALLGLLILAQVPLPDRRFFRFAFPILLTLLLLARGFWGYIQYNDFKSESFKQMDYAVRTEQWKQLLKQKKAPHNYTTLCYHNLALAKQGQLIRNFFQYAQYGAKGFLIPWNKTFLSSAIRSEVLFALGEVANAQSLAFEADISVNGQHSPRMLKRLVQTNLILGSDAVAEKYIHLLEQTLYYRQWAHHERRFLYHPEAVAADPLLGELQRCLPYRNALDAANTTLDQMAWRILCVNPTHEVAYQYLVAYLLVSKDLEGLYSVIHEFALPTHRSLERLTQEALLITKEKEAITQEKETTSKDAELITASVTKRYQAYKRLFLQQQKNPNLASIMQRHFGDTFWFYYMFIH